MQASRQNYIQLFLQRGSFKSTRAFGNLFREKTGVSANDVYLDAKSKPISNTTVAG